MSIDLVKQAKADLEAVLKPLVDTLGVRNVPFGATVQPPVTVVGPPAIRWSGYGTDATEADFSVFVVVARDDRTIERLLDVLEPIVQAIETIAGATVGDVQPTVYAPAELPCYLLPVNVSLS